eukprot:234648-Lingulodinium_polyedra.AAC.1
MQREKQLVESYGHLFIPDNVHENKMKGFQTLVYRQQLVDKCMYKALRPIAERIHHMGVPMPLETIAFSLSVYYRSIRSYVSPAVASLVTKVFCCAANTEA